MSVDHLAKAKLHADRLEVSEALMHGQIATVEALHDLLKVGTSILGQLLDSAAVDAEIVHEVEDLADILRESDEVYPLGTYEGRWNFIARRALEWLNLSPINEGDKK